jgi:cytochrome oxidase assembly protein ShyY1
LHVGIQPADDAHIIRPGEVFFVKTRIALWLAAALLIAGFVSLGSWQLHRAVQKQQMLDSVAAALRLKSARPLAAAAEHPLAYDWASGEGSFRPSPVLLLDNQRRGDAVGVHVFGVFQPDAGQALLVDLGWLPLPGDRRLPDVRLPEGPLSIAGLLTPPPAAGVALGPAYVPSDPTRWLMTRVDLEALATGLHVSLAPRTLRLDPGLPLGYARDLDVLPNTLPPERHRGYALQWFGLALLTFLFALYLSFRRRPA